MINPESSRSETVMVKEHSETQYETEELTILFIKLVS